MASDSELPAALGGSVVVDSGNELLLEKDRLLTEARVESENRDISLQHLNKGIAWLRRSLLDKHELEQKLENTLKQLGTVSWNLQEIQESSGWKCVLLIRQCRDRLLPNGSLRRRILQRIIRFVIAR
jgi:hypothetical protein